MAYVKLIGQHDEGTIRQANTLGGQHELNKVLVMADGHLGYQSMPIGGVTVSERYIAPGGVGFDIGCGNWTGETNIHMSYLGKRYKNELQKLGELILERIDVGLGVGTGSFADHPLLDHIVKETKHIGVPEETIRNQFGSTGGGNHYIDLMVDTEGYIWIALHYGSRKFGHSIAKFYLDMLGAKDGMYSSPEFLDADTPLGQAYLHDMELAGQYAMVSRRLVGTKIATNILHDTVVNTVENHHNYAWKERHQDRDVFVTRKGATPVYPGEYSFIGGSMGTDSVIVTVADDDASIAEAQHLEWSAPHGAGRILGRSQAKGRWKKGRMVRAPKVTQEMMDDAVDAFDVVRIGGGVDESPHCYRNLVEDVLPYHPYLKVVELLRPVLVVMNPDEGRR